jgi:ABC-type multidrug transport system ATPase subunit
LLSEIELIADSMLIIDKGRKVAQGKVADLLNPANTLVEIDTTDKETTRNILQQTQWQVQPSDKIILKMHRKDIPHLAQFLIEKNIEIIAIQPKHSLEDYFLSLTTANQHVATYKN